MLDLNLGSIFTGIQAVRDDQEREKLYIALTSAIVSGAIHAAWEMGSGLATSKWTIWKLLGKTLNHGALSTAAIFLTDTDLRKIYLAIPRDLLRALPADIIVIRANSGTLKDLGIPTQPAPSAPGKPADHGIVPTVSDPLQGIQLGP
jgi:hypothetical protein